MRIGILTQYYPPEIGAPQNRLSDLAQRLVKAGHEVVVLTAMPNYPLGKVYPGYGGIWRRDREGGVEIIRSFIYPTQSVGLVKRLASYLSFVMSSSALGMFMLPRCDVLLTESPPLFLGIAGYFLSRVKGCRLILNVSDIWPESAVHLGIVKRGGLAHRIGLLVEGFLYRKSWLVSCQSRGIMNDILGRFPDIHTYHLSNGADVTRFTLPSPAYDARVRAEANGEFVALYAGLHGVAQGLDQVVEAALQLRDLQRCRVVFIGDGPEKKNLIRHAREKRTDNVTFLDPVTAQQMPACLAAADVLLVPLKSDIPGAVPSKLYEAMASGKPVILVGGGEAATIVQQHQAGLVVKPGDVAGIAAAVRGLYDAPDRRKILGENGRRAVENHFNRETIANQFAAYLEHLLRPSTGVSERELQPRHLEQHIS